jgi:hypothetical protein
MPEVPGTPFASLPLFRLPQTGFIQKEADNEIVDHFRCPCRTHRGRLRCSGAGHDGLTIVRKASNSRELAVLHQYVSQRRPQLQICEHGCVRKGRKAPESELFAQSEQEHNRIQTISFRSRDRCLVRVKWREASTLFANSQKKQRERAVAVKRFIHGQ